MSLILNDLVYGYDNIFPIFSAFCEFVVCCISSLARLLTSLGEHEVFFWRPFFFVIWFGCFVSALWLMVNSEAELPICHQNKGEEVCLCFAISIFIHLCDLYLLSVFVFYGTRKCFLILSLKIILSWKK